MTRDDDARRFAKAMGWTTHDSHGMAFWRTEGPYLFDLPRHDAPLHEHLAFVGRVAEALDDDVMLDTWMTRVTFGGSDDPDHLGQATASDLSWAAMLAAIAANGAK